MSLCTFLSMFTYCTEYNFKKDLYRLDDASAKVLLAEYYYSAYVSSFLGILLEYDMMTPFQSLTFEDILVNFNIFS